MTDVVTHVAQHCTQRIVGCALLPRILDLGAIDAHIAASLIHDHRPGTALEQVCVLTAPFGERMAVLRIATYAITAGRSLARTQNGES